MKPSPKTDRESALLASYDASVYERLSGAVDIAILGTAVKRIRGKLNYSPIGFQPLPDLFTLRQLQEVHETVLGRPLNKDWFRRRMLSSAQLEATGERESEVEHRPAELYRLARRQQSSHRELSWGRRVEVGISTDRPCLLAG